MSKLLLFISVLVLILPIPSKGQTLSSNESFDFHINNLKSKNPKTVEESCKILGQMKDPRAIKPLIKVLKKDENNNSRVAAAEALGEFNNPEIIKPLLKALKRDKNCLVKTKSAEALGKFKDSLSVNPLIEAMNEFSYCDDSFTIAILKALGNIGGNKAFNAIILALQTKELLIFDAAVEIIVNSNDDAAVDFLSKEIDIHENYYLWKARRNAINKLVEYYWAKQWKVATSVNTLDSYTAFLEARPSSLFLEYGFNMYLRKALANYTTVFQKKLETQYRANWVAACQADNIEAYEQFLIKNPSSKDIGNARKRLAELGHDPFIDSIRDGYMEEFKPYPEFLEKFSQGRIYPVIMITVINEEKTPRVVFKDEYYMYNEIIDGKVYKLPVNYELLSGRYSKPFEVFFLFLSQEIADDIINSDKDLIFGTELKESMQELFYLTKSYVGGNKFNIYFQSPAILLPEKKKKKTADKNMIVAAIHKNESDLILNVDNHYTVFDTKIIQQIVQYDLFYTYQGIQIYLSIDSPQGYGLLSEADSYVINSLIKILRDYGFDEDLRNRAANALKDAGVIALPELITAFNESDQTRADIASVLGSIKDPQAVNALINVLGEWYLGPWAAKALETNYWKPKTTKELILYAVAKRDRTVLIGNWSSTKSILLSELNSNNRQRIEGAIYSFIAIGKEEIITDLISIINKKGTKIIAETYLNSGNDQLSRAASTWAYKNGYNIGRGDGGREVKWGGF